MRNPLNGSLKTQVLVIGSGAGGAVTALELASRGMDVTVVEEGDRHDLADYGASPTRAMQRLYRRRGMTPILGSVPRIIRPMFPRWRTNTSAERKSVPQTTSIPYCWVCMRQAARNGNASPISIEESPT